MSNNEQMLSLLNQAYAEGIDDCSTLKAQEFARLNTAHEQEISRINEQHKEELKQEYQRGVADTLAQIDYTPDTEDEEGIPLHNITNYAADDFMAHVPKEGYEQNETSKIVPYLFMIQEKSKASWTESVNPYIVYGDGDTVEMTDENGKVYTYTPYRGAFRLSDLFPEKLYTWKRIKGGKTVDSGQFRTYGTVHMVGFENIVNFRDLYVPGYVKAGKAYRGANADNVTVDSADHKMLKDLGITVELNLRNETKDPARKDLFATTYSYNISDYAQILTSVANLKSAVTAFANSLAAGKAVYVHCFAGADRTGTFCYLMQALCGVPLGILEAHWELTSLSRWCNFKLWNYERSDYQGELRTFVAKISKLYGADPYTHSYRFLTEKCKVEKTVIDKIIANLKK